MKTILKYSFWCLLICFLFTGCVGFDISPTNKFTDDSYWTSQEKASSMLSMAYRQMNDPGRVLRDERLSDNLYNGYGNDEVKVIGNGQANASTGLFDSYWKDVYAGIKTTHTFLANIDRVDMDEAVRERMKAEARFVRAYLFFQLTNWYGNVPFFTEDLTLEESKTISPTPQATIVAWIHSELEEIAEILPTRTQYADADRGRVTRGAAVALNARVALNFNDWARVKTYTEKLVNSTQYGEYSLYRNYQELFYKTNEYNEEIILDVQYVPSLRVWTELSTYVPYSLPGVQFTVACPTQSLVDTYLMKDGSKWDESKGPYENRDPRMDMTIVRNGSTIKPKEGASYTVNVDPNDSNNNTNDRIGKENGTQTGYFVRKYYDPNPEAWTGGTSWDCNINFVTIRFADVLLMYAEALNELNEFNQEAWNKTIKLLRQRAGFENTPAAMDMPSGGQTALRQVIRDERRVELAFEGTRIYDIRRWKIAETVLNEPYRGAKFDMSSGTLDYYSFSNNSFNKDRDYLWAIPRQQLLINPNLGQNPGY